MHSFYIAKNSTPIEKARLPLSGYLIILSFLTGVFCSGFMFFKDSIVSKYYIYFFENYTSLNGTVNYLNWCALCMFSLIIYILILLFLSFSSIGFPFCYIFIFLKGSFCGAITCYLFKTFGLSGLVVCLAKYFFWQLISSAIVMIISYICIENSLMLFKTNILKRVAVKKNSYKNTVLFVFLSIFMGGLLCIITNLGNLLI